MENVYHNTRNLKEASIKQRIKAFRITTLDMISEGQDVEKIREVVENFEDDEMYEAAQGILEAIEDFKRNPQMILKL